MRRSGWTALCAACVMVGVVSGCARGTDGVAVRAGDTTSVPSTPTPSATAEPTETTVPGVIPTTREPVPPDAKPCLQTGPASTATAVVSDPAAPRITIAIPDGWSSSVGSGDVGARLDGPDGMSGTVTIAATTLDPAAAFRQYTDDVMAKSPVSAVSMLPAEFCGYSSQELMGNWSDVPGQSVQFADRIAHIWTNTANYLVAVHLQGPAGAPGFDAATSVLMEDFSVGIP